MPSKNKRKRQQKRSLNSDAVAQRIDELKRSMRKPLPPPVHSHADKKRSVMRKLINDVIRRGKDY